MRPPLRRYGVAVMPMIRIFGLIFLRPSTNVPYIPSSSGWIMCASSTMQMSRWPKISALEYTLWMPATIAGASVSLLPNPAEYIPVFTSGESMFSFSKSCSRSSFTWQRRIARPPHALTVSDMICAATHDLPPPTVISMQGFVFFSRRCL